MKRLIAVFLLILMAFSVAVPVAADKNEEPTLGQIKIQVPEIVVELKGTGYKKEQISGTLDGEELEVTGLNAYAEQNVSTRVYVIIDAAASIDDYQEMIKESILKFSSEMGKDDQLVIYKVTSAKKDTGFEVIFDPREQQNEQLDEVIDELEFDGRKTRLFDAISNVYTRISEQDSTFDREYVLVFSDGQDYNTDSGDVKKVKDYYKTHLLPLYGMCVGDGALNNFKDLCDLSGGAYYELEDEDSFVKYCDEIDDVSFLELKAQTNRTDKSELVIKIGDDKIEQTVLISDSTVDNAPPSVKTIRYDEKKNQICVEFSEKVLNADKIEAYEIIGPDKKKVEIEKVTYDAEADVYQLKSTKKLVEGEYVVGFPQEKVKITDDSEQENGLEESKNLSFIVGGKQMDTKKNGSNMYLWIIAAAIGGVAVVTLIIVLICVSKGKRKREERGGQLPVRDQGGLQQSSGRKPGSVYIKIKIRKGRHYGQEIGTALSGRMIFGRSDVCNVFIDDLKLSRQHFALDVKNGNVYISDLQSRNGTIVNGVQIVGMQILHGETRVNAGLTEITITILGR